MQRYSITVETWPDGVTPLAVSYPSDVGPYVLAADAAAAVEAAEKRGYDSGLVKCLAILDAHHPRCTDACELCAEWDGMRKDLENLENPQ